MFNWTTTTIINSLKDYSTGASLIKVWESAGDADADGLKSGFSGAYPIIKIKRDKTFEARYISKVYRAEAQDYKVFKLTVDADAIKSAVEDLRDADDKSTYSARLSFYIGLEGSEESIYANDWYQKGKPFSVGFSVKKNATAEDIYNSIVANVKKFGVATYGKKIFEISDLNGTEFTISGTHEYQRIKAAAVTVDDVIDEILLDDVFEDGKGDTAIFSLTERGNNGFGTSHQLIKDLRLPTVHHNKWLQIKEDEKVQVGAKYNQYIITYCAPSMANPGFTVIGQHNMSVTTHVFWVNQDVDAEFKTELAKVATVEDVAPVVEDEKTVVKASADAGKTYSANHEQKVVHTEADADAGKTAKGSK